MALDTFNTSHFLLLDFIPSIRAVSEQISLKLAANEPTRVATNRLDLDGPHFLIVPFSLCGATWCHRESDLLYIIVIYRRLILISLSPSLLILF
jgi:hypothetical protein